MKYMVGKGGTPVPPTLRSRPQHGVRKEPPAEKQSAPAGPLAGTPAGDLGSGEENDPEVFYGWVKTWTWTLLGAFVYVAATWILDMLIPQDPAAYALLTRQVPQLVYQMSSTAFFTALVLNLTSLLFEDNAPKRQLALLSCAIKGAACHADMLLVTGRTPVIFDAYGSIVTPQRYIQWLVTTPTMVYILSKISDFTPRQTATAIALDVIMVAFGLMASFMPWPFNWCLFGVSSFCFVGVLYMMGLMVHSAVKEHTNASSRRSLMFIYMCTLFIWTLFPVAWVLRVVHPSSTYKSEILNLFANFMAKVLFSSSIMYGNYMTIKQRRLLAQQEAENTHRIRMVQELKDAVTRKDQFMSLMSHELRTPLNGIIQLSDALVRGAGGEMNPKGQHFVRTIKNSSNHLLNIINDILDVAALKEGKLTIKHEVCSLPKAVDHVVDIVAPLAKKDVAIERAVDPRTPLIIADFSRVIQILYNLAGNALKFTHKGKVTVRVAPSQDGTQVLLQVADTGIGIPSDRIKSIWGAFEQVDMSVTRKYGGTGLGLNIVKQLVEAHEGSIEVQSTEGKGTSFTVYLPVMQSSTRRSLELQVIESLAKNGHSKAQQALAKTVSKRKSLTLEEQIRGDLRQEILKGSGGGGGGGGNGGKLHRRSSGIMLTGSSVEADESGGEMLYRRKTQELERENLMGDLQRRTEHKRSMDEAELASQQLQLSESERRAERDSRSLERTDHLPSVPERSPTRRSSGDTGGGSQGQGQLPQRTSLGSSPAPRRSHLMAWRSEAGPGGGSPGISGSVDAAEALARASMESQAGAGPGSSIRKQRSGSMTGMASGALLPVSMGSSAGAKPTPPASLALRISTYGRGVFGGGSGGTTASTAAANAGNLLLNKALESELYRNGGGGGGGMLDSPFDDASSIGGESESDFAMSGPRTGRRPPKMAHSRNPLRSGPGGMPGSKGHTGPGSIAGASAAAPPPGLTLDKLAYSDMYGTIQILSVDDEEVNQIVLEEILTSSGYHFARCMDGLEALEWLCASETMPDLILLDCMMPNMSGHEFCSTLRRVIPGNVLPVIMVSAKSDEDNIVEGLRSGSNDFVRKPYQREELLARIETQLRLKSDSWWLAELVNNVDGQETESMKLLKNILPESIIQRMQQGQKFVADSHGHVVILFSDIVGFTSLSSKLPTAEVFLMLSNMFTAFDKLTDRFSVYKVETIGDAYMVAAGHDEDDEKERKGTPLVRVLGFARAMLDVVRNITAPNGERLRIRIGVHCGPAFAGVIGMKCPRYCFLGDTVNTASRMESTGFPMCIHVSDNVHRHHPNPESELEEVGERDIKGKGRMRTYLVRAGMWEAALKEYGHRQAAAAAAAAAAANGGQQLQGQSQQLQQVPAQPNHMLAASMDNQQAVVSFLQPMPSTLHRHTSGVLPGSGASIMFRDGQPSMANGGYGLAPPLISAGSAASSYVCPLYGDNGSPVSPDQQQGQGQQLQLVQGHGSSSSPLPNGIPNQVASYGSSGGGSGQGTPMAGAAGPYVLSTVDEEPGSPCSSPTPYNRNYSRTPSATAIGGDGPMVHGAAPYMRSPLARPARAHHSGTGMGAAPPAAGHMGADGGRGGVFGSDAYCIDTSSEDGRSTTTGMGYLYSNTGMGASPNVAGGGASRPSQPSVVGQGQGQGQSPAEVIAANFRPQLAAAGGGDVPSANSEIAAMYSASSQPAVVQRQLSPLRMNPPDNNDNQLQQQQQQQQQQSSQDPHCLPQNSCYQQQQMPLLSHGAVAGRNDDAFPDPVGQISPYGGGGGGYPHTVAAYLEQRIARLASQLAAEATSRQRLQDELDGEKRRSASALQQVAVLLQQLRMASAVRTMVGGGGGGGGGVTSPPPTRRPRSGKPLMLPTPAAPADGAAATDASSDLPPVSPLMAGMPYGVSDSEGESPASPFHTRVSTASRMAAGAAGARAAGGADKVPAAVAVVAAATGGRPLGPIATAGLAAEAEAAAAAREAGPRPPSGAAAGVWAEAMSTPQPKGRPASGQGFPSPIFSRTNAMPTLADALASAAAGARGGLSVSGRHLQLTPSAPVGPVTEGHHPLLPRYGLEQLFCDLGLLPYLGRFQEEAIRLDMLLGMDVEQLERLGLRPLGYCIRVREAVTDLARVLLRMCEEYAIIITEPAVHQHHHQHHHLHVHTGGQAAGPEAGGGGHGGAATARS